MKRSNITIPLVIFLVTCTVLTIVSLFSSKKSTTPTGVKEAEEKTIEPVNLAISASPLPLPTVSKTEGFFLELNTPKEEVTVNISRIEVAGRTNFDSEVFVNEEQVYPDQNNNFRTEVNLEEGENYIIVVAGNEKGDSEIERIVYYEKEVKE